MAGNREVAYVGAGKVVALADPVGFDVTQTAALFRCSQFIHRGLMRALSGWMLATPKYEDKYAMAYHLWDHAQHAFAIRERLKELRGGLPDANIEPALLQVVEEVVHASNTAEFVAGAYLELTETLLEHQCWDEIRHSEFGASRLKQLGVQPQHYDPILYEQVESLPILHRFFHLTLNLEVYFMARKRPRVMQYKERSDRESMVFADVDWSDEINHVRYGKKWVSYFLEADARSVEDLKREIAEFIGQQQKEGHRSEGIEPPF